LEATKAAVNVGKDVGEGVGFSVWGGGVHMRSTNVGDYDADVGSGVEAVVGLASGIRQLFLPIGTAALGERTASILFGDVVDVGQGCGRSAVVTGDVAVDWRIGTLATARQVTLMGSVYFGVIQQRLPEASAKVAGNDGGECEKGEGKAGHHHGENGGADLRDRSCCACSPVDHNDDPIRIRVPPSASQQVPSRWTLLRSPVPCGSTGAQAQHKPQRQSHGEALALGPLFFLIANLGQLAKKITCARPSPPPPVFFSHVLMRSNSVAQHDVQQGQAYAGSQCDNTNSENGVVHRAPLSAQSHLPSATECTVIYRAPLSAQSSIERH
jgi:hypothetical protein